jgi:hypothetical protein
MRKHLWRFKMLKGGIKWFEAIPKNANGRTWKKVLREQSEREGAYETVE